MQKVITLLGHIQIKKFYLLFFICWNYHLNHSQSCSYRGCTEYNVRGAKWRATKMDIEVHHHKVSSTIFQINLNDILKVLL